MRVRAAARARIREMALKGWSQAMIAQALGLSKQRVSVIVGELGLSAVRAESDRVAAIRALASEGLTAAEAAARLGLAVGTVRQAARRHGIVFVRAKRPDWRGDIRDADVAKRWLAGESIVALAARFGCSESLISKRVGRMRAKGVLPARRPSALPADAPAPDAPRRRPVLRAAPPPAPEAAPDCPVAALAARRGLGFVSDLQAIGRGAGEYAALQAVAERHRVTLDVARAGLFAVRAS